MARVSTYLNFPRTSEEAFAFYKDVFNGEYIGDIMRFGDVPPSPDQPMLAPEDENLVVHIELKILNDHVLMATDAPESMGFSVNGGNNMSINLEPDTQDEARRLFEALSDDGAVEMPFQPMFWGGHFGALTDRYGIRWMVNWMPAR